MDVSVYLIYGVPVLALVMGLVKVAREMGLPSKFAPAASMAFGMIGGAGVAYVNAYPAAQGVVVGLVLGLTACGIYDASKKSPDEAEAEDEEEADESWGNT